MLVNTIVGIKDVLKVLELLVFNNLLFLITTIISMVNSHNTPLLMDKSSTRTSKQVQYQYVVLTG